MLDVDPMYAIILPCMYIHQKAQPHEIQIIIIELIGIGMNE